MSVKIITLVLTYTLFQPNTKMICYDGSDTHGGDVVYLECYGRQACPAPEWWPSLNKTCTCLRGRRAANYPRLIAACVRACVSGRGVDTARYLHRLPTLVFVNKKAAGIKEQMALSDWHSICYEVELHMYRVVFRLIVLIKVSSLTYPSKMTH